MIAVVACINDLKTFAFFIAPYLILPSIITAFCRLSVASTP